MTLAGYFIVDTSLRKLSTRLIGQRLIYGCNNGMLRSCEERDGKKCH